MGKIFKLKMKKLIIVACSFMLFTGMSFAQEFKMPVASPSAKIEQQFSTSSITIDYSRPSMKGRVIFGDLVPYDKIWRTGANANTKITFGEDVTINNLPVAAGTYSLYTIPGKDSWLVILNKGTENWGLSGFNEAENVLKVQVSPVILSEPCETFTISVDNLSNNTAILNLQWERVKIPIVILADNKERILAYLDKELQGSKPPYQQAANFYLEQEYKLDKALEFTNKAIEGNKEGFWLFWLKAKILAKMGKNKEALEAAMTASKMTQGTDYEGEYKNNYNKLKAELN